MTEQNEGSPKIANKAAKEFAKWSSKEYKEEVAGEFGATVPTGYVAPNKLDEKTAQKYSGKPTGNRNFNLEAAEEISGTQQAKPLYTVPSPNFKNASPVGYAGTMGGATPANRMTQETAAELNPAAKAGKKNTKKNK